MPEKKKKGYRYIIEWWDDRNKLWRGKDWLSTDNEALRTQTIKQLLGDGLRVRLNGSEGPEDSPEQEKDKKHGKRKQKTLTA